MKENLSFHVGVSNTFTYAYVVHSNLLFILQMIVTIELSSAFVLVFGDMLNPLNNISPISLQASALRRYTKSVMGIRVLFRPLYEWFLVHVIIQ